MGEHAKSKRDEMAEFLRGKPMNHVLFGDFTVEDVYELVKYEQTYGPYVNPQTGDELLLQMLKQKKEAKAKNNPMKMMQQLMGKGGTMG